MTLFSRMKELLLMFVNLPTQFIMDPYLAFDS